ncbi:MAG: bifunctional glutamate N-acetyltransferase/amino-acid acetyltransferase ArgJ [Verrucomicrobiota bacterium]
MSLKSKPYKEIPGGISAPEGFLCHAVSAGIKDPAKPRLDLGLIYSTAPCVTAATFTTNKVKAAPVRVCQAHLKSNDIRAIIVNSGNANACTGPRGIQDAKAMAVATGLALDLKPTQVMVNSTGIIGLPMPIDRITDAVPALVKGLSRDRHAAIAQAIMTSDTKPKSLAIEVPLGSKTIRIAAIAKGAGMICPSMGTMLCFVTTDAAIGLADLKKCTGEAVQNTFNRISIDGDTSTNDTVIVMANGMAGNRKIASGGPQHDAFCQALEYIMRRMARMIVSDGERVTKFVEIAVRGAATYMDARKVAETVANSLLVKCSWNGSDPNWGRVMHAIGYSRAKIREEHIDIYFDGHIATRNGISAGTPLEVLKAAVAKREFTVTIDLNIGDATYTVYTSDLSQEYVDFNKAEYAVRVAP